MKEQLIGLKSIKYELNHLSGDLCHILFSGPRGSGKTSMARYLAEKRGKKLHFVTGNTLKKQELLNLFVQVEEGDIILIDEIHRVRADVEESLYEPMEYFHLPIRAASGQCQVFDLPKFTLIGTTTKSNKLSKPLLSRFQITYQIPHYRLRELAQIILAKTPEIKSRRDALLIGINTVTPREALNLAYRVSKLGTNITDNLQFIGYRYGLSEMERQFLMIVYNVGTLSALSLSSALQLDKEEVAYIEDKLIRKRLVQITSKGRSLTLDGLRKVKVIKANK